MQEMDKIEKNPGVIVLATTSRADPLDKALFHRGRFELVLRVRLLSLLFIFFLGGYA